MGRTHLVTVPSASAHSFDHVGFAVDLVVAGAIRALEGAETVVSATRDDTNIPSVRAGVESGLERFAATTTAVAGEPVDVSSTDSPESHRWMQELWEQLRAQDALETGTFTGAWCEHCESYVDAPVEPAGCPACGRSDLPQRSEDNWFLRTAPFLDALARWRESVVVVGPAAPAAAGSAPVPALMSVSRPASRTGDVGVAVPGDPSQVIHSGLVAAGCYLLPRPGRNWAAAARRTQVCGKGLVNLHTVVVPLLCTALGVPAADRLYVHHHVRVDGASPQSAGRNGSSVSQLLQTHGPAAIRWWLARLGLTRHDADLALRDAPVLHRRELGRDRRAVPHPDPQGFRRRCEADLASLDIARITRSVLAARADPRLLDALPADAGERLGRFTAWVSGSDVPA